MSRQTAVWRGGVVACAVLLALGICSAIHAQDKMTARDGTACEQAGCPSDTYDANGGDAPNRRAAELLPREVEAAAGNIRENEAGSGRARFSGRSKNIQWVPAKREENEFQRFVGASAGLHLPLYGHRFFQNHRDQFAPLESVAVPADYVVGTGDVLLVRISGSVSINARTPVDRNGQIFVPRVGAIAVSGIHYKDLQNLVYGQVVRFFRNFELSITLARFRAVQVLVLGNAERPGTYTVSALSTLINALFVSGGPSANGSMRRIELRRAGQVVTVLDLYDLLARGDGSRDMALANGDVIYIPPAGQFVAITGSVQQPAIYELRGSTSVKEALELAGGLTSTANANLVTLERIGSDRLRHVEEFALDNSAAKPIQDGDLLRVFPISPRFANMVILRGSVERPGKYPWHEGMRISDLLPTPEAIIRTRYWRSRSWLGADHGGWLAERSVRSASGPDSFEEKDVPPRNSTSGLGSQPKAAPVEPGEDRTAPDIPGKYRTEFKRNPAEINWDYAVVQRLNKADLSTEVIPFNLGRAIGSPGSGDDLTLQPDDVVTIFSQQDLSVPVEKRTKFVWIEGEVKAAGVYRVEPGESLRQIVARAGGLTAQAYLFATEFRRESTRREQQENLGRLLDQLEKDLRAKASRLAASASAEERQAGREEMESQRAAIARLRQTRPTGRIVLDLQSSDQDVRALPLLPLEDGDRIIVPSRPATVTVAGAVYNQNSFLHQADKKVKDYLRQSGGPTREADSGRLFVIRADGSVISKQMQRSLWAGSLESLRPMPGDTIVIPEKIRSGSLLRGLRDWSQVFSQFALGAAAIKVISP